MWFLFINVIEFIIYLVGCLVNKLNIVNKVIVGNKYCFKCI